MKFLKLFLLPVLLLVSTTASAVLVDFKAMGNGAMGYGESAWSPLNLLADFGVDVSIKGYAGSSLAYAYLDAGNAGLGVCGDLTSAGDLKLNMKTGSGTNLCNPSSDDNVTVSESLKFTFNEAVTVNSIWFNNAHDGDLSLNGNMITIGGTDVLFSPANKVAPRLSDWLYSSVLSFNAGDVLTIAYKNEEFYISAIDINKRVVPEPASLAILGMGLVGLAFARRRKA